MVRSNRGMTTPAAELSVFETFAVELVRSGGRLAREWAGSRASAMKADDSPVTEADHAVQDAMIARIRAAWPEHAVLAEESSPGGGGAPVPLDARWCWVIDPIDGTRNFARGTRSFACSAALLERGAPVVGAIYDARFDAVFHARRGGGAFREGEPLRVSALGLDDHTIAAISSFRGKPTPAGVHRLMQRIMFRNLGSLCLHLCAVAAGEFDALYSHEAKPWDIAAGGVIVEEAGGRATRPDGGPLWPLDCRGYDGADMPIVAGGATIHPDLLKVLSE